MFSYRWGKNMILAMSISGERRRAQLVVNIKGNSHKFSLRLVSYGERNSLGLYSLPLGLCGSGGREFGNCWSSMQNLR